MRASFEIGNRPVGGGAPCFVIAEAGVNHDGDLGAARALVDAAQAAGADAVKFQTFRASEIVTARGPKAAYQETATPEAMRAMLERLELPLDAFRELAERAAAAGLIFMSTPFDPASARFLASLGMPAFKVPSGEITNVRLLDEVGRHGRPVLVSTGASTLDDVAAAVARLERAGADRVALFHCVTSYPAPASACNLRAMATLRERFRVPVGFSDHTLGREVPVAAVALGAELIEKHFTLDRNREGPDHRASLEPDELASLVAEIRRVEAARGDGAKVPHACELPIRDVARRSVVAARALPAGHVLTAEDLALKRPGTGLAPEALDRLVGRRLARALAEEEPLAWDQLS